MGPIILLIILILIILLLASCIKIVPQAQAYVVERLGAYQGTWSVGLKVKLPIIDKVVRKVNLKEQVVDFAPQPVITKDNVHADRYGSILPDHGSQTVHLRRGESDHGH